MPSTRAEPGWLGALPAVVLLAWAAWDLSFGCDDAYITLRYARNLLEGHGPVFDPGEWR